MHIPLSDQRQNKLSDLEFRQYLSDINNNLDKLSYDQLKEIQRSLKQIDEMQMIEKARTCFLTFVRLCGPSYLKFSSKGQHSQLARAFERMVDGDLKRLTISMPPRFGKSEFGSICLPAWFMGKYPDKKIIQASAGDKIATGFGRFVKGIMDGPMYKKVFPGVAISKDSRASGKFATNRGGTYFAIGVASDVAGLGADLLICDDIVNEQDAKSGKAEAYDAAWNWFLQGPLQRLQPGGRIIIIGTRWSKADPIGRVKRRMKEDPKYDRYESIEFTALDDNDESNFPEIWPTEELRAKRFQTIPQFWNAQYMQAPTTAAGAIIPKHLWKKWEKFRKIPGSIDEVEFVPPECHMTVMCLDTAFTANKRSNPTACTIWGCFDWVDPDGDGDSVPCMILLYSEKRKMEFPALKQQTKEWDKEWGPDVILIEAKTSGVMLRSELGRAGLLTIPVAPKAGEDKVSRLNSITSVFYSGRVWYMPTYANQSVIEEVADFPNGDEDDYTDTVAYTVRYLRGTGMVGAGDDVKDDETVSDDDPIEEGSKY